MNINRKKIRGILKDVGATSVVFRKRGRGKKYVYLTVKVPGTDYITIHSFVAQALYSENVKFYMTSGLFGEITLRVTEQNPEQTLLDLELPELAGWQARLVEEHDNLHAKYEKLFLYINTTDFLLLNNYEQYLLKKQQRLMQEYGKVLAERLIIYKLSSYSKTKRIEFTLDAL